MTSLTWQIEHFNPYKSIQNAETTETELSSQNSPRESFGTFPSRLSAPRSFHNAGSSEKSDPPGMESRRPCAPLYSKFLSAYFFVVTASILGGMGLIGSLPKRFFAYIWRRSAFKNPSLEMTNYGWRRKA